MRPKAAQALGRLLLGFYFASIVIPALPTDMVRAFQFATIRAFGVAGARQSVMRAAHVAPRRTDFSFGDRHGPPPHACDQGLGKARKFRAAAVDSGRKEGAE